MKLKVIIACTAATLASSAYAEGDVEAGAKAFNKCKSCHMIVDDAGEVIVKGGKTGPNLYNIVGRAAGSVEGFRYGKSTVAAGEAGLVWDEEQLAAYIPDPTAFLREYLDDSKARSKMAKQRVKNIEDLTAYLASVSPAAAEMAEEAEATN